MMVVYEALVMHFWESQYQGCAAVTYSREKNQVPNVIDFQDTHNCGRGGFVGMSHL